MFTFSRSWWYAPLYRLKSHMYYSFSLESWHFTGLHICGYFFLSFSFGFLSFSANNETFLKWLQIYCCVWFEMLYSLNWNEWLAWKFQILRGTKIEKFSDKHKRKMKSSNGACLLKELNISLPCKKVLFKTISKIIEMICLPQNVIAWKF